eukprot:gene13641-17289_t
MHKLRPNRSALSPVHRSRDVAAPSLGVSSLDLGLRSGVGLFLCGKASAAGCEPATAGIAIALLDRLNRRPGNHQAAAARS